MGDSRVIMIRIDADGKAAIVNMDKVADGAERMGDNVGKSARKASKELQSFRLTITDTEKSLLDLTMTTATLASLGLGLRSVVDAANQVERANIGLATTARYAGVNLDEARAAAKSLTEDGLISLAEASQGLQNLLSRGFSLPEAIELMNRFKDSAAFNRQASLEFGQAVVSATEGLKNENSILVDNAGVTKNVSIMWKEYAAEHGKTVEQLTQAEKRQAEYNGILRETEGQLGNAGRMTETFSGQTARLNQELFEFKAAAGRELLPLLADIANGIRPIISLLRDFIGGFEMAAVSYGAMGDKVAAVREHLGMLPQVGILDADRRAALKRSWAVIDQAVEEQKEEIFKRLQGGGDAPNIGADTGKRRKDIKLPTKPDNKAARQAESWRRIYAELNAEIAKNQTGVDQWERQIIDVNRRIDDLLRKPGANKARLEEIRKQLVGAIQDERAEEAMRGAFKKLDDAMAARTEREKELLANKKQLTEAELDYQLSMIDSQEKFNQIGQLDATDKRLGYYRELLTSQEEYLKSIDKLADPSGWYAQQNAIRQTRDAIAEAELEMRRLTGSMGEGVRDGAAEYLRQTQTTFEQGKMIVTNAAQGMEDVLGDVFGDAMTGKLQSAADYWAAFEQVIARTFATIIAQQAVAWIMKSLGLAKDDAASATANQTANSMVLVGAMGVEMGMAAALTSSYYALAAAKAAAGAGGAGGGGGSVIAHTGGLILHSGGEVLPRYHSGAYLAPDERRAILQTGERVLSRKQNRMFEGMDQRLASLEERTRGGVEGGGPTTVQNFNFHSLSPQTMAQWVYGNKKLFAGAMLAAGDENHPIRRTR